MGARKARAGGEIGEIAGLFLPDLQCIERQEGAGSRLVEIEPEFAVGRSFYGATGAVADNDWHVGEQDRVMERNLLVVLQRGVGIVALLAAVVFEPNEGIEVAGADRLYA